MSQYGTLITRIGLAKIANAQVTQSTVGLEYIALGDGNGAHYVPTQDQTELVNEVWRGPIANLSIDPNNNNRIIADAVIPNTAGGFTIREIGLFDEDNYLIAVGQYPETYKPLLNEGISEELLIHFTIETANADVVKLAIDPTVIIASRSYVDGKVGEVRDDLNAHKADDTKHMTPAEKNKLAGIQTGAEVNKVTSVAGKTGAVTLVGTDIPNATTTARGTVQLNNTTTSTSTTQAATANVVRVINSKLTGPQLEIGSGASATGANSIAIGLDASATENYSIAIGSEASASRVASTAVGYRSYAENVGQFSLGGNGDSVIVRGHLSVTGTKKFEIPHPHPTKRNTHVIRHGAVESPTAGDTLYRYKVTVSQDNDLKIIDLPDYFIHLNKDVQIFVTPQGHFGNGYGVLNEETEQLEIHCQCEGEYNVLVIGTRNDDHPSVREWDIRGVEREIGESWSGETYVFSVEEIMEVEEIKEELM